MLLCCFLTVYFVQPSMLLFGLMAIQPPPELVVFFQANNNNNNNINSATLNNTRMLPANTPDDNQQEENDKEEVDSAEASPEVEINVLSSSLHEESADDDSSV
jgi:hypothetical protein